MRTLKKPESIQLEMFHLNDLVLQLRQLCNQSNITLIERANGHFHLIDKHLVNYYPFSANKTAYIKDHPSEYKTSLQRAVVIARDGLNI